MTTRLEPGSPAPDFTLVDQDDRPVSLASLRGQGVVLFFYPEAMTPGCTTEACDFRDSLAPLQAAGYTVLGISRDEPEKLRRFRERDGLTFDLLSDPDHAVHEAYGAWGEKLNYGKKVEIAHLRDAAASLRCQRDLQSPCAQPVQRPRRHRRQGIVARRLQLNRHRDRSCGCGHRLRVAAACI